MSIPQSPTKVCDDSFQSNNIWVHTSSKFQTGTTLGSSWLRITANTVNYGLNSNLTNCGGNCLNNAFNILFTINNSATGASYTTTYTSNVGAVYDKFVFGKTLLTSGTSVNTAQTMSGFYRLSDSDIMTIPFTGSSPTLLNNLSGVTCQKFLTKGSTFSNFNTNYRTHYLYNYKIILKNPSNVLDFDIYADDIINDVALETFPYLAARWVNGILTFKNPLYAI